MRNYYIFIALLGIFSVGLFIIGFLSISSPMQMKSLQLDKTRLLDFRQIETAINGYYGLNRALPESLKQLKNKESMLSIQDPQTNRSYTYSVVSSTNYKLCTSFSTDSKDSVDDLSGYREANTNHKKGYDCLSFAVASYLLANPVSVSSSPIRINAAPGVSPMQTSNSSSQFEDVMVKSVTTDAKSIKSESNFPAGFFSSNQASWGLINAGPGPVTVEVTFIKPVQLLAVANLFAGCQGPIANNQNCIKWDVTGVTQENKTENLVSQAAGNLRQTVNSNSAFTKVIITAVNTQVPQGEWKSEIAWEKIKFEYK